MEWNPAIVGSGDIERRHLSESEKQRVLNFLESIEADISNQDALFDALEDAFTAHDIMKAAFEDHRLAAVRKELMAACKAAARNEFPITIGVAATDFLEKVGISDAAKAANTREELIGCWEQGIREAARQAKKGRRVEEEREHFTAELRYVFETFIGQTATSVRSGPFVQWLGCIFAILDGKSEEEGEDLDLHTLAEKVCSDKNADPNEKARLEEGGVKVYQLKRTRSS